MDENKDRLTGPVSEAEDSTAGNEKSPAESVAWVDLPDADNADSMDENTGDADGLAENVAISDKQDNGEADVEEEARRVLAQQRREEIQRYIESLENADFFDNDAYEVKLEYFEGPLDLLLFLVKRSKINIEEIFVSKITEQYIDMMSQIDAVDLDKASDFIEIAACLLEIKAKSLLPKPQEELPEEEDPEKVLMRRLEEYKLFKEATAKLKDYETVGLHYREPDKSVGKPRFILSDMNKDGLMQALTKMFMKLEQRAELNKQRSIVRDRFTVAEKIEQIMEAFEENQTMSFFDLFDADYNKSEIISTFQAMLELLKNQFFTAVQDEAFGDIQLKKVIKNEESDI